MTMQMSTIIKVITISHTLCSKKSDAKIQITITTPYLIRIKYPLSCFNYHLSDVNVANFNKIHRIVYVTFKACNKCSYLVTCTVSFNSHFLSKPALAEDDAF